MKTKLPDVPGTCPERLFVRCALSSTREANARAQARCQYMLRTASQHSHAHRAHSFADIVCVCVCVQYPFVPHRCAFGKLASHIAQRVSRVSCDLRSHALYAGKSVVARNNFRQRTYSFSAQSASIPPLPSSITARRGIGSKPNSSACARRRNVAGWNNEYKMIAFLSVKRLWLVEPS